MGYMSVFLQTLLPLFFPCMKAKSFQSCLTLWNLMDLGPPGSFVHGILQARILEWVAVPSSRGSSQTRDQTYFSYVSCFSTGSLPLAPPGEPSICNLNTEFLWLAGTQCNKFMPTGSVLIHECGENVRVALSRWKSLKDLNMGLSSVQFSRSVVFDSLWPHESQHARPPCSSPSPRVHSDSRPLSQWCHPAISCSVVPFSSCP